MQTFQEIRLFEKFVTLIAFQFLLLLESWYIQSTVELFGLMSKFRLDKTYVQNILGLVIMNIFALTEGESHSYSMQYTPGLISI